MKKVILGCFLGMLCGLSMPASANIIAYDGFDYTLGQTVVGKGTDNGWANSLWTYTLSAGDSASANSEASDTTPYSNLNTSGNQLHLNGSTAPGGAAGVYRNLGTTYNTANNVYWFSVLLQLDNNTQPSYAGVSLFSNDSEALFFGQTSQKSTWGVHSYRGGGVVSSSISTLNSSTGFLVVELNGITHTANLYVNPTSLGGSAPATPNSTFSFADFTFNRFRAQAGNENLDVDELRFGTTYADVTPVSAVPEPAFFQMGLLLGMSGMGVFKLRRKA